MEEAESIAPELQRGSRWRSARAWCGRQWNTIRPGPETRRGATLGTLIAAFCCVVIAGLFLHTGFGYLFDFTFALVAGVLVVTFTALLVMLLMLVARKLPMRATAFVVGTCVVIALIWGPPQLGVPMAIFIGLAMGVLGATIATFLSGEYRRAALSKKIITVALFTLAIAANCAVVWLFTSDGSMDNLSKWRPPAGSMPAPLTIANPADRGPYGVRTVLYGSGTDIRRPEFGSGVAIKTRTVDASDFFKDFKGWKRWARKRYWRFDMDRLPLNARVWMPEGAGPFPLALIVHGNHGMAEFSDPGYAYLGELLASRGIILASIDENFLNSGLFHDPPKQQAVRGWMLLEHLKLWREWKASGKGLGAKVDLTRIALMGHSRGGEAAATAAAFNRMEYDPEDANIRFDYHFPILAVVAIAPADGQYKPAGQHRWIQDVSYLTLQGSHDADVSQFMGSRQWDHVRYSQPGPWFKAEIWSYRANHGQFNTVWGRTDAGEPLSWLLNLKPLLPGEDQRRISKTYISAFLEATLLNHREYLPLFQDWRVGSKWLPDTVYVNRYQDASYVPLVSYDTDADLVTGAGGASRISGEHLSIWREGRIPWRQGDRDYNGVFLGWNRTKGAPAASYSITVAPDAAQKLTAESTIELSVAALDEDAPLPGKKKDEKKPESPKKDREAPDFSLEVAAGGASAAVDVARFAAIPPPLKEKFTKLAMMDSQAYQKDWEPVFQSVRIPLSAFRGIDPAKMSVVRLKFDRTAQSVVCINGIGFGTR